MSPGTLSGRERDVARCAATGATTRRIADELFISARTVESHLASIYRKLGVSNRAGLVAKLAAGDLVSAGDRSASGPVPGLTPAAHFVGRSDEVAQVVAAAAASAHEGLMRIVLIGGESGVGKSSLLAASLDAIRSDRPTSVLVANCIDGLRTPFGPIADAIQGTLRAHAGTLDPVVGPDGGVLGPLMPSFADRLPPMPAELEPAVRPRLVVDSFRAVLAHEARRRPVVLVLEDLHWIDNASVAFLRSLVHDAVAQPILVIGTFRDSELAIEHPLPGLLAEVWPVAFVERINLGGLTLPDALALYDELGGIDPDPALITRLHAASAGNSLYLSTLLRAAATGADTERLPASLREAVVHRVARMGSADDAVVELAAVAGLDFDIAVVEGARERLDLPGTESVLAVAEGACRAGLFAESTKSGADFRFVHDIVRQALLEEISGPRAARYHAAVGAALADIAGRDPRTWPTIAWHLGRSRAAADRHRAGEYALQTLRSGVATLAPDDAAVLATEAIERLPDGDASDRLRLELLVELIDVHNLRLDHQAHRAAVIGATELARRIGTPLDVARALAHYRLIPVTGSSDTEILELVADAVEELSDDDVEGLRLRALLRGYAAYHRAIGGEGFQLGSEAEQALVEARASGDLPTVATVLYNIGGVLLGSPQVGRMAAALAEHDEIRHLIPEHVDRHDGIRLAACAALQAGDRPGFERFRARLSESAEQTQSVFMRSMQVMWTALVDHLEGRLDDAALANDELLSLALADPNVLLGWFVQLVAIRTAQARGAEVLPIAEATLAEHPDIPAINALVAWVAAEAGDVARAWEIVEPFATDGFAAVRDDWTLAATLAWFAPTVIAEGTAAHARILLDRLLPYSGQLVLAGSATLVPGAADRHIGVLLARVGEVGRGLAHLAAAVELERTVGAPREAARSQIETARVLLDRGSVGDRTDADDLLAEVRTAADAGAWPHLLHHVDALLAHR
jgi:DNA-binding CsgD family transcriptional regulator